MSRDPVETEPPYPYVANRPTWAVDPSGMQGGGGVWEAWWRYRREHPEGSGFTVDQVLDGLVNAPLMVGEYLWKGFIEWQARVGERIEELIGVRLDSAWWSSMRNSKSAGIRALAPPAHPPDFLRWFGGRTWGIIETAARMFLGLPADAIRLGRYLLTKGRHILGDLWNFVCQTWGSIWQALPGLPELDEYTRGKVVGHVIAGVIGLFLAGRGALALMKGLPAALKRAVEAATDLATSVSEAARSLRFRFDPKFAEDVWNRTWRDINDAYRRGRSGGFRKPPYTPAEGRAWAAPFHRPVAKGVPGSASNKYQVDQCGPYEYTVVGSGSAAGVQVDVDGIDFALGLFVDAKHVGKPAQGPYIRGSGDPPGRVRDLILDTTRSEVRRMGLILVDGRCPLVGVEIRVNDPGAVLTFEAILQESGVPGRVVVAK